MSFATYQTQHTTLHLTIDDETCCITAATQERGTTLDLIYDLNAEAAIMQSLLKERAEYAKDNC